MTVESKFTAGIQGTHHHKSRISNPFSRFISIYLSISVNLGTGPKLGDCARVAVQGDDTLMITKHLVY